MSRLGGARLRHVKPTTYFKPLTPLQMENPPDTLWLIARWPVERQACREMGHRLILQTK